MGGNHRNLLLLLHTQEHRNSPGAVESSSDIDSEKLSRSDTIMEEEEEIKYLKRPWEKVHIEQVEKIEEKSTSSPSQR